MGHATNLAAANEAWWDLYYELKFREFVIPDREILLTGSSYALAHIFS